MAFKRAEASSPDCPPDKNANTGNSGRTDSEDISSWHQPLRPPIPALGITIRASTMLVSKSCFKHHFLCVKLVKYSAQKLPLLLQSNAAIMLAIHEHFGFNQWVPILCPGII